MDGASHRTTIAAMFERFTDQSRRVVILAQEEARELGSTYLGTEHLLLGLTRQEEGRAADILTSLGVGHERLAHLARAVLGNHEPTTSGHMPFSTNAKKAFEDTMRAAISRGSSSIDTEHLLLGLLTNADNAAVALLDDLGVTVGTVRSAINEACGGGLPDSRARRLSQRLLDLDSLMRDVLGLHYGLREARNYTIEEIADKLEISVGEVEAAHLAALAHLAS